MLATYKKAPDKTRCIVAVTSSGAWHSSQCKKPRGHGPNGEYCIMHSKMIQREEDRVKLVAAENEKFKNQVEKTAELTIKLRDTAARCWRATENRQPVFNEMIDLVAEIISLEGERSLPYSLSNIRGFVLAHGQPDGVASFIKDAVLVVDGREVEQLRQKLRGYASTLSDGLVRATTDYIERRLG